MKLSILFTLALLFLFFEVQGDKLKNVQNDNNVVPSGAAPKSNTFVIHKPENVNFFFFVPHEPQKVHVKNVLNDEQVKASGTAPKGKLQKPKKVQDKSVQTDKLIRKSGTLVAPKGKNNTSVLHEPKKVQNVAVAPAAPTATPPPPPPRDMGNIVAMHAPKNPYAHMV